MSNHTFFSSNFKKSGHIKQTEALDIDGATKLVNTVVSVRVDFLHSCTLVKLICLDNGVNFLVSAPVHKIGEHELHLG